MFELDIPFLPGWMIEQLKRDAERRRQQVGDTPSVYDDSDPRKYYCRGTEPEPASEVYEISLV